MQRSSLLLLATLVATAEVSAQSNSRGSSYDGALSNISSPRAWGRRGAAHPNGELGVSFQNQLCNPGTVPIEWRAPMLQDHPFFSFLVVRLQNDRLIQVSDWSHCKHAFLSLNSPSSCGGTCVQPPAGGSQLGVSCSDIYSNGNNADRNYLGPPVEIDPWLGTWNPVGSFFDRGFPDVGSPNNRDGARSTITPTDAVMNRVIIQEANVLGAASGTLFFQIQVVHQGEPASNRDNNVMSRPFNLNWSGTAWSATVTGLPTATLGTVLTRWPGAQVNMAGNGNDDGRFQIASKVTGPNASGLWHYEYAVLNLDNHRGGASFRLPVCSTGRVLNLGFRDIDKTTLNDWTATVSNGEIAWQATAGNAQDWNQLFNFWFDSDVGPVAGQATIDQARVGPGALSFSVPTQVPGLQHGVYLGDGCGVPALELRSNGVPSAGNANFAIEAIGAPNTGLFAFFSWATAAQTVAPGCMQWLDTGSLGTHGFLLTDGTGRATIPLGVPAGFAPVDLNWQAAALIPGGPLFGSFGLSNGLKVRLAGSTCQ